MKHKTHELTGESLRRAVAMACDYRVEREDGPGSAWVVWFTPGEMPDDVPCASFTKTGYAPDIKPAQAWVFIERDKIELQASSDGSWMANRWPAEPEDGNELWSGATSLIAACRAKVASVYGDEVDLPG